MSLRATSAKVSRRISVVLIEYADDACIMLDIDESTRLCEFKWMGELGRGSFGCVHKVFDREKGIYYAVKFQALTEQKRDELGLKFAARSIEEATGELRKMHKISSPFVVDVYAKGVTDREVLWAVIELCSGGELFNRFGKHQTDPISDDIAWRWVSEITQGLAALHELNIVHRDLKMQNCFLTSTSDEAAHCKLGDLGLAKEVDTPGAEMSSVVGTQVSTMRPTLHFYIF